MFSKTYSEIENTWPINSNKKEIALSRDSKELFVQCFVEVFNQNQKYVEARNQRTGTPADFTVLCKDCQKQPPEVLYKKTVLKILQYSQETPVLEFIFKKVADL